MHGILEEDTMQERKVEDGGSSSTETYVPTSYLLIAWRHVPEGRSLNYVL